MPFSKLVFLNLAFAFVSSIQPNCEPDNQFRSYCFSIKYCNGYKCNEDDCGNFIAVNTKLIEIIKGKIIPKCAFTNANELKYIKGVNKEIEVIASGAFVNLPKIESVILPFNLIKELHQGIFRNVSLTSLDLSWNRIVYVQEGAFSGIDGLKHLNLSRNQLFTLPVQRLSPSLINLNLSYNFLETLALNYARFPNLTTIDISNNELERVALFFETPIDEIDLTNNRLDNIDLFEVQHCERLRIPQNNFSSVPDFLKYSSIKNLSLHPNPWKCNELMKLWTYLQNNLVNVEDDSQEGKPICSDHVSLNFVRYAQGTKKCIDDFHCDSNELCRGAYCRDPCKHNACDPGSTCIANNHRFECLCPGSQKRDPREVYSPCLDVQCFLNSDCNPGHYCNNKQVCVRYPPHTTPRPISGGYGHGATHPTFPPSQGTKQEPLPWWFYEIPRLAPKHDKPLD